MHKISTYRAALVSDPYMGAFEGPEITPPTAFQKLGQKWVSYHLSHVSRPPA
jgi:hypothetical protein